MYAPSLAGDPEASEAGLPIFRASASPGAAISIMKMNRESTCGTCCLPFGANAHSAPRGGAA